MLLSRLQYVRVIASDPNFRNEYDLRSNWMHDPLVTGLSEEFLCVGKPQYEGFTLSVH